MTSAAPTSSVDICNLALDRIGDSPISSIDMPTSQKEETVSRWYDQVRRTLLREYVWNFAQAYGTLSRSGDGNGPYEDKYPLPVDCVRLNTIGTDKDYPVTDYEIMGRDLHCSEGNSVNVWYNRDETDVNMMDAAFINIFVLRLAMKIAVKFSKKKGLREDISRELAEEEGKAVSVDGQERVPRRRQTSKYLTARRYGGSYGRNPQYYEYNS